MAEAIHETAKAKKTAYVSFSKNTAVLTTSDGVHAKIMVAPTAVVTTAPDWTDIFLLARRYDRKKAGKQEFQGLWIHPSQPHRLLTFTIERQGADEIQPSGRKMILDRFQITLRSGGYIVWADSAGRVYKLMPPKKPAAAVVLEGFEESTRGLGQ